MPKYIKPKCECGKDLVLWQEEIYHTYTPITNNGEFSQKGIQKFFDGDGAYERLRCPNCDKEYDYTKDDKGRIVRGDIWDIWNS